MKYGGFDYGSHEYLLRQPYDPWWQFVQNGYSMVLSARKALTKEAYSYRNFHVGASLLAVNGQAERMGLYSAGNLKVNPETEKFCAEASVIQQAEADGMTRAIGLVVVGTMDADRIKGVTGRSTPTLHPCESCLNVFVDSPLIHSDTIVVTIGDNSDAHQVHSVGQLIRIYQNPYPDDDHQSLEDPGFEGWTVKQFVYSYMANSAITQICEVPKSDIALMATQAIYLTA